MVEGGSDQAHQPGHVPENLIPKKLDETDGAASQLAPSHRLVCRGYGARWRSPARRVLVVLEVAVAESRPSTFFGISPASITSTERMRPQNSSNCVSTGGSGRAPRPAS